ncbi:alkB, alkylation repair protein 6 [Lophiostoma macrostomum CBS 122681]|uniref:AlkB, alkylation repair protein 6 n=1 Tax=Lophiostoma macrostomum CBS 122681 TaxID=1314788 RepID=A0A6A6SWS7_9PLEO|nr:alkB, alkylation repair protein 6 [Lophiostoma macrostomum CBS 122681]
MTPACELSDLQQFRISSLPPDFYYIPNFLSVEEEASILQKIPAQRWVTLFRRRLQAHPSTLTKNNTLLGSPLPSYLVKPVVDRFEALQIFSHTPHKQPNHVLINEYKEGEGIMSHEDGNAYASVVATVSLGASICLEVAHKPAAMDREVSQQNAQTAGDSKLARDEVDRAGSESTISQYAVPARILQEPRSLLITTGPAYRDLLHGIDSVKVDEDLNPSTVANWDLLGDSTAFEKAGGRNERGTRISLTYRDVLKVSSAASKVLGGLGTR